MKRQRTREHLTPTEVKALLEATKKKGLSRNPIRDHCLLFLMVRHGLRVSEAIQLKLSDIDLEPENGPCSPAQKRKAKRSPDLG